jgi:hypothetical protein
MGEQLELDGFGAKGGSGTQGRGIIGLAPLDGPAVSSARNEETERNMGQPAKIARNHVGEPYVPRIRALVEEGRVREARALVKEALRESPSEPGVTGWSEVLAPAKILQTRSATDFDRSAEILWLEEHADEYRGQWVALLRNELLAHADTLEELTTKLETVPRDARALLHRIY